ncbi:MAG TPA: glycosyltransferase family 1 protein [Solirubrobacteraceae bacterium]|nr:glycosyltransferase family 1 protein [Solirubrobacteraceae bacterium]
MHVGFNLIFLVPGETGGMEIAAQELIAALLSQARAGDRFTAFVNSETAAARDWPLRDALPQVRVPVRARRREQWVIGEQALLAPMAMRAGVQLVHSLASTAPLWGRFRRVVTVHDLIYARFPGAHSGIRDKGMRVLVPAAARRSDRVIADSRSTRDDLVALAGIAPQRIDVIPLGLGTVQREPPLGEVHTRERFELGDRRVLLSLSAKRPHKNIPALIDALALIEAPQRPLLVLPGYHTWHEDELRERARARGVEADVRLPGWVSGPELEGLWALSAAFVFPSLYEGFGLPVLEAMARGVPVACSDAASLPEVAGDAALLFDPRDTRAIASAVRRLLAGGSEVERLREKGRERAARFTWERTASLTLQSYERALAPE